MREKLRREKKRVFDIFLTFLSSNREIFFTKKKSFILFTQISLERKYFSYNSNGNNDAYSQRDLIKNFLIFNT